jgi:signal transduction histidine kinase
MKDAGLRDDERQTRSSIDRNARIQTRLVEDLLDESRMAQGRVPGRRPLDLRTIVDSAIEARVTADANIMTFDRDMQDVPVMGDFEVRLQQAVWNLLITW